MFIVDLIKHLETVALTSDPVFLAGQLIRALLLAEDLALVAHSAADLQALLDACAAYCGPHLFQIQVGRTEAVVFSCEGDPFRPHSGMARDLVNKRGELRECELSRDIEFFRAFYYKKKHLKVVPSFVYLGVLLHWFLSAIAAGKDRDTTGLKAFGSISAPLNKAPFLPLYRTLEIAESTVGGAFLHGAELWGAFVSLFSLSVPREFSGWLLGFGSKPRADRLLGWLELRDLAVQATARAAHFMMRRDMVDCSLSRSHSSTTIGRAHVVAVHGMAHFCVRSAKFGLDSRLSARLLCSGTVLHR